MFNELVDVLGLLYEDADEDAELAAEVEKLIEARQNYENFGACDEKFEGVVELMEEDGIV